MQSFDVVTPFGSNRVVQFHDRAFQLQGDGKVDRDAIRDYVDCGGRQDNLVTDLQSAKMAEFCRTMDPSVLGDGWCNLYRSGNHGLYYSRPVGEAGPMQSVFVDYDCPAPTVELRTFIFGGIVPPGESDNFLVANFEPGTGRVVPETIEETTCFMRGKDEAILVDGRTYNGRVWAADDPVGPQPNASR
ncbi:MAG: hypothetical protein HY319_07830 [Armatimonadetes bacterium]|nr:hypothetical protein [Armatimonadota bacterium]